MNKKRAIEIISEELNELCMADDEVQQSFPQLLADAYLIAIDSLKIEIVRCWECMYYAPTKEENCLNVNGMWNQDLSRDDFCSNGERRKQWNE